MLSNSKTRLGKAMRRFHNDEAGMEALQTVLILAVAAFVMFGVYELWEGNVKGGVTDSVNNLLDMTSGLIGF